MTGKITEYDLPIVSEETVVSFLRDLIRKRANNDYVIDMVNRLNEDNPELPKLAKKLSIGDSDNYQRILMGIYATYEILRRQSETNRLESIIF